MIEEFHQLKQQMTIPKGCIIDHHSSPPSNFGDVYFFKRDVLSLPYGLWND